MQKAYTRPDRELQDLGERAREIQDFYEDRALAAMKKAGTTDAQLAEHEAIALRFALRMACADLLVVLDDGAAPIDAHAEACPGAMPESVAGIA